MNVLSIDFDIIMAPDIELYNHFVDDQNTVQSLTEGYPILNYSRADLNHYVKLVHLILNTTKDLGIEDIRVALSHEDIKNVLNDCHDVKVFNIDHHHDCGYVPREKDKPNDCSCANWVRFFMDKDIIKECVWLKNSNSTKIPEESEFQFDDKLIEMNLHEVDNLISKIGKVDKLFLCLSPEWVPELYWPLFYLLLDLINQQKECHLEVH